MARFDPITLEILWSKVIAALDESATTLVRTAFCSIMREANDFACVLTDPCGHSIGQSALSTPSFLNTIPVTIQHFLLEHPAETLRPGDVLITNDPWIASGHLNDVTLAMPIFHREKLVAFAGVCGHVSDIGGRQRSPDSEELYVEGLQIPICKMWEAGEINALMLKVITENVRTPEEVGGDLTALASSLDVTRDRVLEMLADYDLQNLEDFTAQVQQISEAAMRKAIAAIPDGEYRSTVAMDGYESPLTIACALRVQGDEIEVDYAGTSPRVAKAINSVLNYTHSYTVYPIKCVIDPFTRNNAGSIRPIRVTAPEDSLLNPKKPAPVATREITGHLLHEAIFKCLAQTIPEQVQATSYGPGWNVVIGGAKGRDGDPFSVFYTFTGGQGGSRAVDGISCIRFPSNICNTPIEMQENRVPWRVEQKELRPDSGGPGTHRGGLGQRVRLRITGEHPVTLGFVMDRTRAGAPGLVQGGDGQVGYCRFNGSPFNPKEQFLGKPGDLLELDVPGGGGYGDPTLRSRADIERDLRVGNVTLEHARAAYGYRKPSSQ